MNSLFICATPLQCMIAEKIMDTKSMDSSNCLLFSYTKNRNKKLEYYYTKLSNRCSKSKLYLQNSPFPFYLLEAKKYFASLDYDNLYFANINNIYPMLALSRSETANVYTFDDGTGNLVSSGVLSQAYEFPEAAKLAYFLFGNRYSVSKARARTKGHYTIYPSITNCVSENTIPISLYQQPARCATKSSCSIILGTVFSELFDTAQCPTVQQNIVELSQKIKGDVFYISHPRGEQIEGMQSIEIFSDLIAEDIILGLFNRYNRIDLYGFCSTTQVNLLKVKGIRNIFLFASGGQSSMENLRRLSREISGPTSYFVNLDNGEFMPRTLTELTRQEDRDDS